MSRQKGLPTEAKQRKNIPMVRGLLDYFPAALAEVAVVSKVGNDQHNPGEPLHWARDKSTDHADCIVRHLVDRGKLDTDGVRHAAKVAWRALALLQEELEADGYAPGRGSWFPKESTPLNIRPEASGTFTLDTPPDPAILGESVGDGDDDDDELEDLI